MPKTAPVLNDVQLKAIKQPGLHSVGGVKGLLMRVQVAKDGSLTKSFILRVAVRGEYRASKTNDGKQYQARRDFGLGSYPGGISLKQARENALALRDQLSKGLDPTEQKRLERAQRAEQRAKLQTFKTVALRFFEDKKAPEIPNPRNRDRWINQLLMHTTELHALPLPSITTGMIADCVRDLLIAKPETGQRVRQRIGQVFDYAVAHGLIDSSPADSRKVGKLLPAHAHVLAQGGGVKHRPRLALADMARFWLDLGTREAIGSKALRFKLLTTTRSAEVRGARWDEFDLEARIWTIPADRMKMKKPHRVPLSGQAVELLQSLPRSSGLVFPSPRGLELSDMTLSKLMKDMHEADVKRGGGYFDPDQPGTIATPHGTARSTFKDWARHEGFDDQISELQLAHTVGSKVQRAYARDDMLEQRRGMMQRYADFVTGGAKD